MSFLNKERWSKHRYFQNIGKYKNLNMRQDDCASISVNLPFNIELNFRQKPSNISLFSTIKTISGTSECHVFIANSYILN